jgi:trimeric autotransporter adhesin
VPHRHHFRSKAAFAVLLALPLAGLAAVDAHAAPARVQRVSWHPNGAVHVIATTRTRVFVGGEFTRMVNTTTHRQVKRVRVAALSRSDGALDRSFHAQVNGTVTALAVFDHKLYLGGDFTRVNGVNRQHLAALRLSDSHLVRGRHIQVDGPVLALLHMGPRLYVGGDFTQAGGLSRSKLFAMRRTGTLVPNWPDQSATTDGGAYVLAASPHRDTVIVGGAFHHLVGQARTSLGAISTAGQVTQWTPAPACSTNCFVKDLAVGTKRVYAGIAGPGGRARAYRLSDAAIAWTVRTNGDVNAIAQHGSHLLLGGHFDKVRGHPHRMFAEVATATGAVMSRTLATSGPRYPGILAIDVRGRVAMLGGAFDEINRQQRLAAIAA